MTSCAKAASIKCQIDDMTPHYTARQNWCRLRLGLGLSGFHDLRLAAAPAGIVRAVMALVLTIDGAHLMERFVPLPPP